MTYMRKESENEWIYVYIYMIVMQETQVQSLSGEDHLEEEMATYSHILGIITRKIMQLQKET